MSRHEVRHVVAIHTLPAAGADVNISRVTRRMCPGRYFGRQNKSCSLDPSLSPLRTSVVSVGRGAAVRRRIGGVSPLAALWRASNRSGWATLPTGGRDNERARARVEATGIIDFLRPKFATAENRRRRRPSHSPICSGLSSVPSNGESR